MVFEHHFWSMKMLSVQRLVPSCAWSASSSAHVRPTRRQPQAGSSDRVGPIQHDTRVQRARSRETVWERFDHDLRKPPQYKHTAHWAHTEAVEVLRVVLFMRIELRLQLGGARLHGRQRVQACLAGGGLLLLRPSRTLSPPPRSAICARAPVTYG